MKRTQITTFPLLQGIETSFDPKLPQIPWLKLENAFFSAKGTLEKREGILEYTNTTNKFLGIHQDTLFTFDPLVSVKSEVTSTHADSLYEDTFRTPGAQDTYFHCYKSYKQGVYQPEAYKNFSIYSLGDIEVVTARISSGNQYIMTKETSTGEIREELEIIDATGYTPIVITVSSGSTATYVYYIKNLNLYYRTISSTTGAIGAETLVLSNAVTNAEFPFISHCDVNPTGYNLVAFCFRANGTEYCLITHAPDTNIIDTTAFFAVTTTGPCDLIPGSSAETIRLIYHDGTGVNTPSIKSQTFTLSLSTSGSATTLWSGDATRGRDYRFPLQNLAAVKESSSLFHVVFNTKGATQAVGDRTIQERQGYYCRVGDSSGTLTPISIVFDDCQMATIPVIRTGGECLSTWYYEQFVYPSAADGYLAHPTGVSSQRKYITLGFPYKDSSIQLEPIASFYSAEGFGGRTRNAISIVSQSPFSCCIPLLRWTGSEIGGISELAVLSDSECDPCVLEGKNNAIIPSAVPRIFDGTTLREFGFVSFPEALFAYLSIYTAVGTNGLTLGQTYGYASTYSVKDAQGNVWESIPGFTDKKVCLDTDYAGRVIFPPFQLTSTPNENAYVNIYRTLGDGDTYHQIAELVVASGQLYWDDTITDAVAALKPTLYTEGNRLENDSPTGFEAQTIWQGRHWYASEVDKGKRLFFSKVFEEGRGIEHSIIQYVDIPEESNPVTALNVTADQLVIFKKDSIYSIYGEGPNDTGQGGGYSAPRKVSSSVGCFRQGASGEIDAGTIFSGKNGIWLVSNSNLQIVPIGERVLYWTKRYNYTSCTVVKNYEIVLFQAQDAGSPSLVYFPRWDNWVTWTNFETASKAVAGLDTLFWKSEETKTSFMTPLAYSDNGAAIPITIETGHISLKGLMEYQRVYRALMLGTANAAHTLSSWIQYDGVPNWLNITPVYPTSGNVTPFTNDEYYTSTTTGSSYSQNQYLVSIPFPYSKSNTIRLRLQESSTSNAIAFTAIGFEFKPISGSHRIGSNRWSG